MGRGQAQRIISGLEAFRAGWLEDLMVPRMAGVRGTPEEWRLHPEISATLRRNHLRLDPSLPCRLSDIGAQCTDHILIMSKKRRHIYTIITNSIQ